MTIILKQNQKNQGFTLFEAIIYIGLTSIFLISLMSFILGVLNEKQRELADEDILYNSSFILAKITQEIEKAENIILPETSGQILSLEMDIEENNPTNFSLNEGRVVMSRGAGSEVSISSASIKILSLEFIRIGADGDIPSLKTKITLSSLITEREQSFETSATLRK